VAVGSGVAVASGVGLGVSVVDGESLGLGETDAPGTGGDVLFCGSGTGRTPKSTAL
jgi:hypothetical protein